MMLTKRYFYLALLCCTLLLSACGSSRRLAVPEPERPSWHTMDVPVRLAVTSPERLAAGARLSMVRDSSLYLSVRMLGMEVAYLTAAGDSVLICDRFHKLYASDRLSRILPPHLASLHTLQALLLGAEIPDELRGIVTAVDPAPAAAMMPARQVNVSVNSFSKPLRGQLDYETDQLVLDQPARQLPRIPRNAQRLDTDALLKALFQQ